MCLDYQVWKLFFIEILITTMVKLIKEVYFKIQNLQLQINTWILNCFPKMNSQKTSSNLQILIRINCKILKALMLK
jgi:hypothetical protein